MPEWWTAVNWTKVFLPDVSPIEIFVRGTVIYLVLFALVRVVPVRQIGGLGAGDLLVVILIAESVGKGMTGETASVGNVLLLAATIMFWNYLLNFLDYRVPGFHRLYRPQPLPLVKDGRPVLRNLKREFITIDELTAALRLQGIQNISDVREACLEADGRISVVTDENHAQGAPDRVGR
jgi:uncharacterized membrane protein YcaP (DUF421 family)